MCVLPLPFVLVHVLVQLSTADLCPGHRRMMQARVGGTGWDAPDCWHINPEGLSFKQWCLMFVPHPSQRAKDDPVECLL